MLMTKLAKKQFILTEHIYRILIGRGQRLVCEFCQLPITVQGYGYCPKCKTKTPFEEMEWDERLRRRRNKCKCCGNTNLQIVYTTIVVPKRRRHKTVYYHLECYKKIFIDIPDEEE